MPNTTQHWIAYGWLCVAIMGSTACEPKRIPPMTVADLMEDRVTLDGVLMKCNQSPSKARSDSDCLNARIAIERLAKDVDRNAIIAAGSRKSGLARPFAR